MGDTSAVRRVPDDHRVVVIRRTFLTVVIASCVVLVPWIGYLAVRLPQHYLAGQWKVAWVGFDIALVLSLAATAWLAWDRRQLMLPSTLISATLLVCDAWFDVALNWGTSDLMWAVASAVFAELPLAALLFYVANRIVHALLRGVWHQSGRSGAPPALRRVRITELFDPPAGATRNPDAQASSAAGTD